MVRIRRFWVIKVRKLSEIGFFDPKTPNFDYNCQNCSEIGVFRSQKSKLWSLIVKIVQNSGFLGHNSQKVVRNGVFYTKNHKLCL